MDPWREVFQHDDWRSDLAAVQDAASARQLRQATMCGRPLGGSEFVDRIERELDRRLKPQPVGRPRRDAKSPPKEERMHLEIGI
jgi:hypothetical protein